MRNGKGVAAVRIAGVRSGLKIQRPFERPRSLDLMATKEVFDLVNEIKAEIEHTPSQSAVADA